MFTCGRCGDGTHSLALSDLQSHEQRSGKYSLPEGWFDQVPFWIYPPSFHFLFRCPGCESTVAVYVCVHDTRFHGKEYAIEWVQVGDPHPESGEADE